MNTDSDMLVLQNRISWEKFDNVRKTQGLVSTENKKVDENAEEMPSRKRKHGCKSENLGINKDQLLQEAQSWQPNQQVNWTQLGKKYGLTTPNCGKIIKEYLAEQGIPAACVDQCTQRAQRRSKKQLPGGKVSIPMYQPVKKIKQQVQERIISGEICIGDEIVPTTHTRYIVQEGEIREETIEVTARKIPLSEIRHSLKFGTL